MDRHDSARAQGAANDRLLPVPDVAERCAVGVRTVWSWIASGRLKAIKLSKRCTRIHERDLRAFLEAAPSNT